MDEQTANEIRELLNKVSDDTSLQESKDIIDTLHTGNNPMWVQVNGGGCKNQN